MIKFFIRRARSVIGFIFLVLLLGVSARTTFAFDQVVTNCSNDTELRNDLTAMQGGGGGGTLTFQCGKATINLTSVLPDINTATTVDGGNKITLNGGNGTRHFMVRSAGTLTLKNIVLTNGSSSGDGGSIYNDFGWVILNHATIQNSTAGGSGGAIVTYGQLNINDSVLANNKGANGGAVYPRWSGGQVTIQNSVLHHNQTTSGTDGWGGAILLWDGAAVAILNSDIYSNTARIGGAIYNNFSNSSISLQDSAVRDNKATTGSGGGIYSGYGILTTNNVTLSGNSAKLSGGGILFYSVSSASIVKTTFSGNSAESGGGGMEVYLSSGVNVTNSTFSGNSAPFGGGIDVIKASQSLTNVTIFGNSSTLGASGLENNTYGGQGTRLKNTIIAGSLAGANCHDQNAQTIVSDDANLSDDTSCSAYFNKSHDLNGSTNNPMLGPLANNGGSTKTHLPQSGSPALNAGIPGGAPTTDQRGIARPQGTAVDIGAVERCETKPAKPGLVTPNNGTKAKGPQVTLDWTDVLCAGKFNVVVRLGSSSGAIVFSKKNLASSTTPTNALVKAQTYFWQVTAVGDAGKTKSDWWSFKVK